MLTKQEITRIFDSFTGKKVLVIGDVMLDSYWWGHVDRISPEAPVPIVLVKKKEYRLGGAANVALNLKKLGAEPILCSVIGNDPEGAIFLELLKNEKISTDGIIFSETRPTTVKTRILSEKHQLLRIDSEDDTWIEENENSRLTDSIDSLLLTADLVVFEDYDKGAISAGLIENVVN